MPGGGQNPCLRTRSDIAEVVDESSLQCPLIQVNMSKARQKLAAAADEQATCQWDTSTLDPVSHHCHLHTHILSKGMRWQCWEVQRQFYSSPLVVILPLSAFSPAPSHRSIMRTVHRSRNF